MLVADLFVGEEKKAVLGWVSVAGSPRPRSCCCPSRDGYCATFCLTGDAHACSYTADRFTLVIQFLVLGGALLAALLSVTALKDANKDLPEGEFWFLLLSSAVGAALLPASRDLATLIVALEVASLPAFALVGIKRGASSRRCRVFLSLRHRDRRQSHGRQLRLRDDRQPRPDPDRGQDPARRRTVPHPRPGGRRRS